MESTNAANEFVGSPVFTILVIIGVVAIGVVLRLLFHSDNSEYKHKSDD